MPANIDLSEALDRIERGSNPVPTKRASLAQTLQDVLGVIGSGGYPHPTIPIPVAEQPIDAVTRAHFTVPDRPLYPPQAEPPVTPLAVGITEPAQPALGKIADIAQMAVPGVNPMETRGIQERMDLASALAPNVETTPLTAQQLLGGSADFIGFTPQDVMNIANTRLAQLNTKSAVDKASLDFLRESTGQKTAEDLVKSKVAEEGRQAETKFATESSAAEAVKAFNRQAIIENKKNQVELAKTFLQARAKATGAEGAQDRWKALQAQIKIEVAKKYPEVAAGLSEFPDINELLATVRQSDALPAGTPGKLNPELRNLFLDSISKGLKGETALPSILKEEEE